MGEDLLKKQQQSQSSQSQSEDTKDEAGSDSSASSDWKCLPEDQGAEASVTSNDLAFWQKKAEEEESSRKKLEVELKEWRKQWQQQADKAEAREKEAQEEAMTWQERAAEEGKQRAKAEAEWAKWQNQAEWQESFRRRAEKEVVELHEKLANAEHWRAQWQNKAETEENLYMLYQQKAKEEGNHHNHWCSKAKEEANLRAKAEEEAAEWKHKAEHEANCRQRFEQDANQYLKEAKDEKALRTNLENKIEVDQTIHQFKQQATDKMKLGAQRVPDKERDGMQIFKATLPNDGVRGAAALMMNSMNFMNFAGHHGAEHAFDIAGNNSSLRGKVFTSPKLHFEGLANTSLNYRFKLRAFFSNDASPLLNLEWVLVPGPEPSSLCWPLPGEKVNIILRAISKFERYVNVNEVVLDVTKCPGFQAYLNDAAPPSSEDGPGWVVKSLVPSHEWSWNTTAVVQAELVLK